MNSSRRGFLSLLGGGAIAGPKALKGTVAKVVGSEPTNISSIVTGQAMSPEVDMSWRAREVLDMIRRPQQTATRNKYHDHVFPDVEALVSVSPVNKHRMNKQRERERNLAYHIRDLVQHYKLDWMGLSEEQLVEQIENIAWDRP